MPKPINPSDFELTRHFNAWEFVPLAILVKGQNVVRACIDERTFLFIEDLRVYINRPIYINTYGIGGHLMYSGYRPFDVEIGALWSQHKFGRAGDLKVAGMTPETLLDAVVELMKSGRTPKNNHPNAAENPEVTPTWLHLDWGNSLRGELYKQTIKIFNP